MQCRAWTHKYTFNSNKISTPYICIASYLWVCIISCCLFILTCIYSSHELINYVLECIKKIIISCQCKGSLFKLIKKIKLIGTYYYISWFFFVKIMNLPCRMQISISKEIIYIDPNLSWHGNIGTRLRKFSLLSLPFQVKLVEF